MVHFRWLRAALAAAAIFSVVPAQAGPAGWTLLHEQDASASQVSLHWVVRSGSLNDPLDRPGLAHFTARALFRGTTTRPHADLTQALQALSAVVEIEPHHEFTKFLFTFPANRLDPFLHLMRDVFSNPEFDPAEINLLRSELLAESRAIQQDAPRLVSRVALREFYSGTTAQSAPEGEVSGLARLSAADVRRFYFEHYGISNFVLAMVSPLDEAVVRAKLAQLLGSVPDVTSQPLQLPAPTATGVSAVVVSDSAALDMPFQLLLPGVAAGDAERIGLEVANRVFGVGPDSRLAQFAPNLNGWLTWATSGFAQLVPTSGGVGPYSVTGSAAPRYISDVVPATVDLFRWFVDGGLSDHEFLQARDETLAAAPALTSSPAGRRDERLDSLLSGRPLLDVPGWQSELSRWSAKTVSASMKARLFLHPVVLVVLGDPAQLVPMLQSIPGMGSVRVIPR